MYVNNSLFIFMCILREIFPRKKTLGHCARGAPPILYVPMFPWKYFFPMKMGKK
jgi:hypothetical protein